VKEKNIKSTQKLTPDRRQHPGLWIWTNQHSRTWNNQLQYQVLWRSSATTHKLPSKGVDVTRSKIIYV